MSSTIKTGEFLSVIDANKGIIYKIANAYCKDVDDRKDLVQEIILQLWKSFDKYNDQYKYSTWIYRIALNVAISFYRREDRRRNDTALFSDDVLNITDTGIANEMEANIGLLHNALLSLKKLIRHSCYCISTTKATGR